MLCKSWAKNAILSPTWRPCCGTLLERWRCWFKRLSASTQLFHLQLWQLCSPIGSVMPWLSSRYKRSIESTWGNRAFNRWVIFVGLQATVNIFDLFQCIASHPDTKPFFIEANILMFLYPFLHTTSTVRFSQPHKMNSIFFKLMIWNLQSRPFEYIRLTSLGVIGALVKTDEGVSEFYIETSSVRSKIDFCVRLIL